MPRTHASIPKFRNEGVTANNVCPKPRTAWLGSAPYGSSQWKASSKRRVRLLPPDMRNCKEWLNQTDSQLLNRECASVGGHYYYGHESTQPLEEASFLATSAPHSPDPRPIRRKSLIRRKKHSELLSACMPLTHDSTINHMTKQPSRQGVRGRYYQPNQLSKLMIDPGCETGRDYHKEHLDGKFRHAYSELLDTAGCMTKDSVLTRKYGAAYGDVRSPDGIPEPRVDHRKLRKHASAHRQVAPELIPSDEEGRMNVSLADSSLFKKYNCSFIFDGENYRTQTKTRKLSKSKKPPRSSFVASVLP